MKTDFGKVQYMVRSPGGGNGVASVKLILTLIGHEDEEALRDKGLAGLRRDRVLRLTMEAKEQGAMLGYEDLCGLLLTSLATLKRDISTLEQQGYAVPLRGRKKNGKGMHFRPGPKR